MATRSAVNVEIRFLSENLGGRSHPLVAGSYRPMISFDDQPEPLPWSVVVQLAAVPDKQGYTKATLKFLVDDAPIDELRARRAFSLWEGPHRVAVGRVLGRE